MWPLLRGPTRRFWERNASHWDERIQPDSPEHLAGLQAACDMLPATPADILEIGTGTGSGALALAGRFANASVCAVDLSDSMISAARAKVPPELASRVQFQSADASHLPFGAASFDLVAQINVPLFFSEIARVLRPGGYVVVVSSLGPTTPYHTPEAVVERGFARYGLHTAATGSAGAATYWCGGLGEQH